jgi:hypothetical protein
VRERRERRALRTHPRSRFSHRNEMIGARTAAVY